MSDVNATTPESKRQAIAERLWVNADGVETSEETATGFTYVWKASGRKFTYQFGAGSGDPAVMCAVFGGLTKAGNIANTWKNLPENERGSDPIDDIAEWFKALDDGKWGEERAGGVGTRFDKAALAKALAQVTGADEAKFLARLEAGEKITPKGEKREILFGTYALRNKSVKDAYEVIVPPTNAPVTADLVA